jgi:hypothetical protein
MENGFNFLIIFLSVVIFILLFWMIYSKWFSGENVIHSSQLNLNTTNPLPNIVASTLTNPTSTRYAYGLWVYVSNWNTNTKVLFSRNSDVILYLDKTSGSLNCVLKPSGYTNPTVDPNSLFTSPSPSPSPSTSTSTSQTTNIQFTITNNFPLQKWVYIILNFDNTILDVYLDGKMIKSITVPQVSPDGVSAINYGYNWDAVIANFKRWSYPLDPQSAWNAYMAGNGSGLAGLAGQYHGSFTITKGTNPYSDFKLF